MLLEGIDWRMPQRTLRAATRGLRRSRRDYWMRLPPVRPPMCAPHEARAQWISVPSSPTAPRASHRRRRCCASSPQRDAEVALLKLMVDKLKLQLLQRRVREHTGAPASSSTTLRSTLIDGEATGCSEAGAEAAAPKPQPRKPRRDRASCPRTCRARRRSTTPDDGTTRADDSPAAAAACGGKLRQIGEDVSEQLEYVPGALQGHPPCAPQARLRALPERSSRRRRRAGRSRAAWPGQGCSRT